MKEVTFIFNYLSRCYDKEKIINHPKRQEKCQTPPNFCLFSNEFVVILFKLMIEPNCFCIVTDANAESSKATRQ